MRTLMVLSLCVATTVVARAADPGYHVVKEIAIGGEGGWDYVIVDAATHRLYASHATKIVVADTETGAIVGEITNTEGVHGFAIAPGASTRRSSIRRSSSLANSIARGTSGKSPWRVTPF